MKKLRQNVSTIVINFFFFFLVAIEIGLGKIAFLIKCSKGLSNLVFYNIPTESKLITIIGLCVCITLLKYNVK